MTVLPFAATTPVRIGRVGLRARDADRVAGYYRSLLGLSETRRSGTTISLGVGGRDLLEIEGSSALKEDDPRSAGLFHTAFLLPSRADLARFMRHTTDARIPVQGASDHFVSEALYLTDPEGNGVEIYADRPSESWRGADGTLRMGTEALDMENLLGEIGPGSPAWDGAPEGTVIGHVHLRVGHVGEAEAWWRDAQGFDTMAHYGASAVFLSSGGYHHHIGANTWQSRGAGPRLADRSGLSYVELVSEAARGETVMADPWGTEIRITPPQS